jgi:hypothetical protein
VLPVPLRIAYSNSASAADDANSSEWCGVARTASRALMHRIAAPFDSLRRIGRLRSHLQTQDALAGIFHPLRVSSASSSSVQS